jgi:hypothetical protein
MIIPVRCFTCGKVRLDHCRVLKLRSANVDRIHLMHCVSLGGLTTILPAGCGKQVGNLPGTPAARIQRRVRH